MIKEVTKRVMESYASKNCIKGFFNSLSFYLEIVILNLDFFIITDEVEEMSMYDEGGEEGGEGDQGMEGEEEEGGGDVTIQVGTW